MAKILVIIPHDGFRDEELDAIMEKSAKAGHTVSIGSSHHTEARGAYGKLIKPDVTLSYVEEADYDCIVFIGGAGIVEYVSDGDVSRLILRFTQSRKVVAAIGMAVELLIYAGVLSGKKATADVTTAPKLADAGAYFTGKYTEWDSNILTGSGYKASEEFADELVRGLEFVK
jgi:protease I